MLARLIIELQNGTPLVYELDPEQVTSLGRNQKNTIVLQDEHSSRRHAEIFRDNGLWVIRDLGTRNGTFVDGKRIGRQERLENGKEISIGNTRLRFTHDVVDTRSTAEVELPFSTSGEGTSSSNLTSTQLLPDELNAMYTFMAASMEETDPRALVRMALQTVHVQTMSSVTGFLGLDPEDPLPKMILPESGHVDIQLSRYLTKKVQHEGRPVWLKPSAQGEVTTSESLLLFTDALCVPLRSEGAPLGALHVYKTGRYFSERDLRFCEILAGHLANSLRLLRVRRTLEAENSRLRHYLPVPDEIIGDSPPLQNLRRLIARVAPLPSTVLILGESGVGKELVALALHRQSPRCQSPLVSINCAAIAPNLLEAELFGYCKHAFTGAERDHAGLFQQADEGTLFMDEIGELSPDCQAKLLRVMDGKGFRPVGASAELRVDVRIVAATNRDLEREVKAGRFREDLYFRLRVIPIPVPPLRDHPQDIPPLVSFFLEKLALECHRRVKLTEAAMRRLLDYSWPGNVRQLRSLLECALALCETDLIDVDDLALPAEVPTHNQPTLNLEELEAGAIRQALRQTGGNVTQAARLLGIVRDTLASRMKRFGITRQDVGGAE